MQLIGRDYRAVLKDELSRRQSTNPQYSLRAFAKALDLSPTTLSSVLAGKRSLAEESIHRICQACNFDPQQARQFRAMVLSIDGRTPELRLQYARELEQFTTQEVPARDLSVAAFRVVADWYHLALLELLETRPFKRLKPEKQLQHLKNELGISDFEAKQALERLESLGLIERKGDQIFRCADTVRVGDTVPSTALRAHHRQYLEKAIAALQTQKFEECDFSGLVVPTDPAQLKKAKALIKSFRKKMNQLLVGKEPRTVYRLSIALFKVTNGEP